MPTSRGCDGDKARRCLRVFFSHLFSNVGLFTVVVGYVLLGAVTFEYLECGYELDKRGEIQRYREECLRDLWSVTVKLNVLYEKNWTILVHEQLRKFEKNVVEAAKMEGYDGKELMDSDRQWSFSGALLYSVTVITTIGYGNLAPKTPEGKLVTMLYALIGIPLMLLCLSNLGSLLAGTFQFAYSHACCMSSGKKKIESSAIKLVTQVEMSPTREPESSPAVMRTCTIDPRNRNRTRPLTPEVRKLLTECAEYSLAHNKNPDAGTQKLLYELNNKVSNVEEHNEESDTNSCKETEDLPNDVTLHGTPSRAPLIWPQSPLNISSSYREQKCRPPTPPPRRQTESSNIVSTTSKVPIFLVLLVLGCYICVGAAIFAMWEEWTFLDGAYFCFITLSTIGFGDLVPGKSFQRSNTRDGQLQLVACSVYLILGLVLIAMSFTLVQEEVLAKCRQVAYFIGFYKSTDHDDCLHDKLST